LANPLFNSQLVNLVHNTHFEVTRRGRIKSLECMLLCMGFVRLLFFAFSRFCIWGWSVRRSGAHSHRRSIGCCKMCGGNWTRL